MTDNLNIAEDPRKDSTTLEREINQNRAEMNQTLDALEQKLTAGQLLDQCLRFFGKTVSEIGSSLREICSRKSYSVNSHGDGDRVMMFFPGRRSTARSYDFETATNPGAMFLALLQKHRPV